MISIVMPVLNQGKYIEQAIESVLSQSYTDRELIVIDGGSSDETISIITKYLPKIAYFVSEKDEGQSDAINKGVRRAKGDWVNWINGDDMLLEGALSFVAEAASQAPVETKILTFCCEWLDERTGERGLLPAWAPCSYKEFLDPQSKRFMPQPSTFVRKEYLFLDRRLHYAMDWDLYLRLLVLYPGSVYSRSDVVALYRAHDQTKSSRGFNAFLEEGVRIVSELEQSAGVDRLWLRDWLRLARFNLSRMRATNFGMFKRQLSEVWIAARFPKEALAYWRARKR